MLVLLLSLQLVCCDHISEMLLVTSWLCTLHFRSTLHHALECQPTSASMPYVEWDSGMCRWMPRTQTTTCRRSRCSKEPNVSRHRCCQLQRTPSAYAALTGIAIVSTSNSRALPLAAHLFHCLPSRLPFQAHLLAADPV